MEYSSPNQDCFRSGASTGQVTTPTLGITWNGVLNHNDNGNDAQPAAPERALHRKGQDFPIPPSVRNPKLIVWDEDRPPVENFEILGKYLADGGDLFRLPGYGSGLLLAPVNPNIKPVIINSPQQLAPVIDDRVRVCVMKDGEREGWHIPIKYLRSMQASEAFLQHFLPVDYVFKTPLYRADFTLVAPGLSDDGPGQRRLYLGAPPRISQYLALTRKFLGVMEFSNEADRTNAMGAKLTVMLRNHWPGAKPVVLATSTKSHGGKDTILKFACGSTRHVAVSFGTQDWAIENSVVAAIKRDPELGAIVLENARINRSDGVLASGFIERLVTDPEPLLYSYRAGNPVRRKNDLVIGVSTNFGTVSEDLLNRALPIHLNPVGDVGSRESPIGNPKYEFLPAHCEELEAEAHGMIERWVHAGRPLDKTIRHPFTAWAQTVGGILLVSGFKCFLANYALRKTADDPMRRGLGLLGSARPDQWLRPDDWARLSVSLGLEKQVIPPADRGADKGRERGIGVVLSAHQEETFRVETDDEILTLQLKRQRGRFEKQAPHVRYCFAVLERDDLPDDTVDPKWSGLAVQ